MPCPSLVQTAAGLATTTGIDTSLSFSLAEIAVLRELAERVSDISRQTAQNEKAKLWTAHNDLKESRPLLFCDPENGWNEIIRQNDLRCVDPLARVWEMSLRKELFWGTEMGDDRVVESFFNVPYHYSDTAWGLREKRIGGDSGGAYRHDAPLRDYEADFHKLAFPRITIDQDMSDRTLALAREIFGDILRVRRWGMWWWTMGMTWDFITLRGLDNFMLDMYDNPEWVHRTMEFLRDGTMAKLDFLEKNGLLLSNTGGAYVGSGGFGWTEQLPDHGFNPEKIRCIDMWGFAESQETVGVGADMFAEFVMPYQMPILGRFGLNCYGCCEPLDKRWDVVKRIPRLRRVSVSAWADAEAMAEALRGDYIMSWKPSPAPLSRPKLDEDEVRKQIRSVVSAAKKNGCRLEMIMKDNHTLGNNPQNATRWCRIAHEEMEA